MSSPASNRRLSLALMSATVLLMVGAVWVRGIRGSVPQLPQDRALAPDDIAEPLQLLSAGSRLRVGELTPRIADQRRQAWLAFHTRPFELEGCPKLLDWLATSDGQRVERLASDLRRGSRHEALGSLALLFQVARTTEWAPGVLGTKNAERLGGLFQDWLRKWAEASTDDAMLSEPALAAALAYARIMRLAYDSPAIGRADAPLDRARVFLEGLTGVGEPRLTDFGEALSTHHPGAFATFRRSSDLLEGFDREAVVQFPELDGECE